MNLSQLPDRARKVEKETKAFFKGLKKSKLRELDDVVHRLHDEETADINCLECGNCCRTLGPRITDKDIERMAKTLRMKATDVIETYLRIDEDNDYVFKQMPCPFLGADNYCAIYGQHPKACREYPHTDRKKFYQIHALSIRNAQTCPVVFNVLERLKKEL